jgi:hypothetical protein
VATKRQQHCGYLPREEWAEPCCLPPRFATGAPPTEIRLSATEAVTICPGYLVRLPAVVEAAQGYLALTYGELSTVFPRPSHAVVEGALEVGAARTRHEAAELVKMRDKR